MKSKREDIFKKLMKQAKADQAPANFTAMVMKEVFAGVQEETAVNPVLKSLLQQRAGKEISADFTAKIMTQIELRPQLSVYKPVISKKAMYAIAASVLTAIALILLSGKPKNLPNAVSYSNRINEVIAYISSISPLVILTLIIACILLFADFIFNRISLRKVNAWH